MLDDIILQSVGVLENVVLPNFQNPVFPTNPENPNFPSPANPEFNNNLELFMGVGQALSQTFDPTALQFPSLS